MTAVTRRTKLRRSRQKLRSRSPSSSCNGSTPGTPFEGLRQVGRLRSCGPQGPASRPSGTPDCSATAPLPPARLSVPVCSVAGCQNNAKMSSRIVTGLRQATRAHRLSHLLAGGMRMCPVTIQECLGLPHLSCRGVSLLAGALLVEPP